MRIKELDAFRGIAALAVVIYHYTTRYNQIYDTTSLFNFHAGWLGVPFFFILSGFVITLTVNKCKSPVEFLYRRFIRLYPTYWICLIITISILYLLNYNQLQIPMLDTIINFTMWHQFFEFRHVDGAYWSLLPELLFYCLMAFLMVFNKTNNVLVYNVPILILCFIHYFWPIPILWRFLNLHYVLLFMIGISFYNIYNGKKEKYYHSLIICNLVLSLFMYQIAQPGHSIKFLLITFSAIVGLFYLFVYGKLKFFGNSRILVFLGVISYPLYLVHQNIGYIIINNFDKSFGLRNIGIVIAVFVSICLAYGVTFFIEPPLKKNIRNIKLNRIYLRKEKTQ